MTQSLFFDPDKTYDDNYDNGPFNRDPTDYRSNQDPEYDFLGHKINFPFGIAAGSLPTSRHTDAAFRLGYDVVCYKTQRNGNFKSNQFPNILPLDVDGDLTLEKLNQPIITRQDYPADLNKLSITNSFGVPSRGHEVWADDMKKALEGAGKGQLLIMCVMGTIQEGFSQDQYYDDFAQAAKHAKDAGAKIIEINLSCPNVASEGIICYSPDAVFEICQRVKNAIGDIPLIIKIGYFKPEQQGKLEEVVERTKNLVAAISAINTLQGKIVTPDGRQALPGEGRQKSGICGAGIKWAGLDMVKRLDTLRRQKGYDYQIIGVGGVMNPDDFSDYRRAGADVVLSVTGAMWNQYLAQDIKRQIS